MVGSTLPGVPSLATYPPFGAMLFDRASLSDRPTVGEISQAIFGVVLVIILFSRLLPFVFFTRTRGTFIVRLRWILRILFYLVCAILIVGVVLLLRRGGDDPFYRLIRGTLPGVVLYIGLAVSYTSLRLEMAFLPALAVGLALLLETLRSHRAASTPEHRDRPGPPVRDELLVPTS